MHQKTIFLFPNHGYLILSKAIELQLLNLLLMTLKSMFLGQTSVGLQIPIHTLKRDLWI